MGSIPSVRQAPEAYNTVTLAGRPLPGVVNVKVDRGRKIDKKSPSGNDGAVTTDKGAEAGTLTITWTIWDDVNQTVTDAMFAEAEEILARLSPPAGSTVRPEPLQVAHPVARLLGMKAVVVEKVSGQDVDDKGLLVFTLSCIEWSPPKPKGTKTPKKADFYDDGLTADQNRAVGLGIPVTGDATRDGLAASILRSDIAREEAKKNPVGTSPPDLSVVGPFGGGPPAGPPTKTGKPPVNEL